MKLERMQNDPALFELLVIGCAVEEELEEAEAREYVLDMIQRTKGFLADDYDRIMKEIKHKINVYLQIAVGRARFLRNREMDIRGNADLTIYHRIHDGDRMEIRAAGRDGRTFFTGQK